MVTRQATDPVKTAAMKSSIVRTSAIRPRPDSVSSRKPGNRGFDWRGFPTGWFQVAWSEELEIGQVLVLTYFDTDIILYRGHSGRPYAMDAYCQHMGAHLGYGGKVVQDDIVCPFHTWRWSGADGQNVDVPYSTRKCLSRKMRTWRVIEIGGLLLIWYHPGGHPPKWQPTPHRRAADPDFYSIYPYGAIREQVRFPVQFLLENVTDNAHLKYVHEWAKIPTAEFRAEGPVFHSKINGVLKNGAPVTITEEAWGLGYLKSEMEWTTPTAQVICMTPIDGEYWDFRASIWCKRQDGDPTGEPTGWAKRYIEIQHRELLGPDRDRPIWDNQIYIPKPPFPREEAKDMVQMRRWTRQFYEE